MNYKLLLEKYIKYVSECEGTDFIGDRDYSDPWSSCETKFTPSEWEFLKEISNKPNEE